MTTRRLAPSLLCAALLLGPGAAPDALAVELREVLARFDEVQGSLRTLSAEFTETTRSALLKEPIVAKGRFYMTKPDSVRWEYTAPEPMRFVIAGDQYTGYFPQQKRAEKRDIHRWSEHLFRFIGLGQVSSELEQFYDIRLEQPAPEMSGTHLLVLEPTKKRVRKRMEDVRFWIDATTHLPVRVEYSSKSGTTRLIDFDSIAINPDLAASLYEVELPADVTVTSGFSALSGFSGGASK